MRVEIGKVTLVLGDSLTFAQAQCEASFDAIVTDPPYGLDFMGKEWDHGVPGVEFWREFLRVAKPGAHLVAFGGTRTWHRLAVAIEDAGWEIRDTLCWLYGTGFPKSLDVSKAIDAAAGAERAVVSYDVSRARPNRLYEGGALGNIGGTGRVSDRTDNGATITAPATDAARQWSGWGTALKPAHEPIILARKPLVGTVASNVLAHGTGALNIDACRIATPDQKGGASYANDSMRAVGRERDGGIGFAQRAGDPQDGKGRWPANVIFDEEAAQLLDEQTGVLTSGSVTYDQTLETSVALGVKRRMLSPEQVYSDFGGASRFFYCAKASRSERTHGGAVENKHPTVKPLDLMRWLVRLVAPPGGLVLDPFMGSGTTGLAALVEGFRFVGIERDAENFATARARLSAGA